MKYLFSKVILSSRFKKGSCLFLVREFGQVTESSMLAFRVMRPCKSIRNMSFTEKFRKLFQTNHQILLLNKSSVTLCNTMCEKGP